MWLQERWYQDAFCFQYPATSVTTSALLRSCHFLNPRLDSTVFVSSVKILVRYFGVVTVQTKFVIWSTIMPWSGYVWNWKMVYFTPRVVVLVSVSTRMACIFCARYIALGFREVGRAKIKLQIWCWDLVTSESMKVITSLLFNQIQGKHSREYTSYTHFYKRGHIYTYIKRLNRHISRWDHYIRKRIFE